VGLLEGQSGKQVFSQTHILLKDRNTLLLYKKEDFKTEKAVYFIEENQSEITTPISLLIEKTEEKSSLEKNTIFVDKNLISFPLQLRKWQTGDVFYPLGMKGKKKVSKYFKDEKFSLLQKENTWLLCTYKNEIIWVINKRLDRRFSVSDKTKNILKIFYK
jgi:tRNA(Ile)-lysidine synthase